MDWNYYHITVAGPDNEEVRRHIGQSREGWQFEFTGYLGSIESFAAWRKELKRGKIVDNDGRTFKAEEFFQLVRFKQADIRNINRYLHLQPKERSVEGVWLDKEGYSFCLAQGAKQLTEQLAG